MEERRKFSLRKADVEHSAHHLNDFTYMLLTHQSFSFISAYPLLPSAPPTISVISCVMLA